MTRILPDPFGSATGSTGNPTEHLSQGQPGRGRPDLNGAIPIGKVGKQLPWLDSMGGPVWERLARIPARRPMGLPHGWGPRGVRAAYVRRFGKPPHWDSRRRRYVYSRDELLAVADLLEAETAAWGAGR
jgi:hypothetical protein